ncbi:gp85 [Mycobacterium phage Barnyard]|uniref:Uncharacterized protein n=1 Tax=Mycobacterium phage Barnyard TaxID=205880 RepID=Q855Y7_9CAUD|nr:gp85 [Mycobacterium phage Barnyard]AAN02139.1 hypothetical protein PBI_BARNYARD_85 [Mycobacterium phage Barnyard]
MADMQPEDWTALQMLGPSPNHDPFHNYVRIDGTLTQKGFAALKFADAISEEASRRFTEYREKWGDRASSATTGAGTDG